MFFCAEHYYYMYKKQPHIVLDYYIWLCSFSQVSNFLKEQAKSAQNVPGGPPPDVNDEQHNTIVSQIFEHEDKDKDGFISHEEFSGPKHDEL